MMERDLARHVVRAAFRAERELTELLPLLKQHVDAEGYADLARDIAAAVDAINVALLAKVLSAHPDMEAEIDANIRKYDRFL